MTDKQLSKFLSLLLRHQPEKIGLTLDEYGWADVEELLLKMKENGTTVELERLKHIVDNNNKQRFAFDDQLKKIRANQGHSIAINLNLAPIQPPDLLYHGTAQKNLDSILEKGILKGSRQYVHLSGDKETAFKVGQRHGKAVILTIQAGQMYLDEMAFFCSKNKVWLTDYVAPKYIKT